MLLFVSVWFAVALRVVFRARIVPMIFKILLLGLVYLFLMIMVFVLFIIAFLVFIKKVDIFA